MAISYVSAQEDYTVMESGGTQTTSIDTGTRTNGLLVVMSFALTSNTLNSYSMTYAGVSMTEAVHLSGWLTNYHLYLHYLAAPSDGADDLVISYSVQGGGSILNFYWIAAWFDGVDQTSPLDNTNSGSGSTDPSVSITPNVDNCLVVDMYQSEADSVLSVGSGETLIIDEDMAVRVAGASYVVQTTATAQTVDWAGVDDNWGLVVASFKEASGAAAGDSIPYLAALRRQSHLLVR